MSSNSGTIINRTNETSPFFNALKSRNSKSLPELYSAEINTEAAAESRVEVESSSNPGYNRTMRIELPRYGILNRLYLHSTFSAAAGTHAVAAYCTNVQNIGAVMFNECRIVYNGATIAKLSNEGIISDLYKHSGDAEIEKLIELLGGYEGPGVHVVNARYIDGSTATSLDADPNTAVNGVIAKHSVNPAQRSITAQDFYCPLDFWFSAKHSSNRGLDCSVLSSPIFLEVDVQAQAKLWAQQGTALTLPTLTNLQAICYLTELDPEVEKQFRSITYAPGGAPLTQIGFQEEHVIVASNQGISASGDTVVEVKLNQFSGNVFKLVVYAQNSAALSIAGLMSSVKPLAIKEIQLKATGTNIYNADQLGDKESILNSYHDGGRFCGARGSFATANNAHPIHLEDKCMIVPDHFYELNFKKPYDYSKVSASGSVSMGQLSVPSLRVVINESDVGAFAYGSPGTGAATLRPEGAPATAVDIHVVAYSTALMSYQTNSSGSTNIRMIQN